MKTSRMTTTTSTTSSIPSRSRKRALINERAAVTDDPVRPPTAQSELAMYHQSISRSDSWISSVNSVPISVAALRLGLRQAKSGSISPCPRCGAELRSESSRRGRGPIAIYANNQKWKCHRGDCGAHGGTLDLICLARYGEPLARRDSRWADVAAFCEAQGWMVGRTYHHSDQSITGGGPARAAEGWTPGHGQEGYPLAREVLALRDSCLPVDQDPDGRAWCISRALDYNLISSLDLARVLPRGGECPEWAHLGTHPWSSGDWRLLVPTFDHLGALRSVRAREIIVRPGELGGGGHLKSIAPTGVSTGGLFMADSTLIDLLRNPGVEDGNHRAELLVVEGEPDFLTWAIQNEVVHRGRYAVMGVYSGAWNKEVVSRLPKGFDVVVRTHDDPGGERLAAQIIAGCRGFAATIIRQPAGKRTP